MLQQRRHDQLIAIATRHIEQVTTEFFDVPCLGRQDIGNMIRQEPGRHVRRVKQLEPRFYRASRPGKTWAG
jgi:hypothetical protein